MSQAVAIGDDGRPPGSDDGPLLAALKTWFGELREQARRDMDAHVLAVRQALYQATPNGVPVAAGGSVPASGTLVLDLGGPQLGRRWLVRRLAVANGLSVTTALAGRADWYIGQPSATANPATWQATMGALPAVQLVTSESVPVLPSDHLYAVISTGTAGQVAVAVATILDYSTESAAGPAVQVI